jgi:hypothetical protein
MSKSQVTPGDCKHAGVEDMLDGSNVVRILRSGERMASTHGVGSIALHYYFLVSIGRFLRDPPH